MASLIGLDSTSSGFDPGLQDPPVTFGVWGDSGDADGVIGSRGPLVADSSAMHLDVRGSRAARLCLVAVLGGAALAACSSGSSKPAEKLAPEDTANATLTLAANYYAGGGLADSEVRWQVNATPASFTPPNRGDFTFGKWFPWWHYDDEPPDTPGESFTGVTDASGVRIELKVWPALLDFHTPPVPDPPPSLAT